ncbi:hypothetical protein F442_19441 [Phytophthora nicotianae P10297]|uniref:RxLR effector protein n=1 Tax=Phytophthora nicotianae P10297 TaxID=1317064 RepID=W2YAT2_PHYNI|nr:hypothetical protein F442_19441 [Phytophthora nicotianae P10297]
MRFKLFLFVLVNIFATVSNGSILTDSDSNTGKGLIDTDDKMRHLRGTLNHAKTNDEERIAPVAAFAAGYLGAQQARMRAEQLAKQGGKVAAANHATQTNKIGVDKISGALTSASKKDRAGAIAFSLLSSAYLWRPAQSFIYWLNHAIPPLASNSET